jgi:hypothetical protein
MTELLDAFSKLDPQARTHFIGQALAMLESQEEAEQLLQALIQRTTAQDYGLDEAQQADLEQRFAAVEVGATKLLDGAQTEQDIIKAHGVTL